MTCAICRGGELHHGTGQKVLSRGATTLVVKDVPALVCDTCGERFFDADTARHLLDLIREVEKAGVVIDVRHYVAA